MFFLSHQIFSPELRARLVEDIQHFVDQNPDLDGQKFAGDLHSLLKSKYSPWKFCVGSYRGDIAYDGEHYYNVGNNVVHKLRDNRRNWFVAFMKPQPNERYLDDNINVCLTNNINKDKNFEGNGCDVIRSEKMTACLKKFGSIICVDYGLHMSQEQTGNLYTTNVETWKQLKSMYANVTEYVSVTLIIAGTN